MKTTDRTRDSQRRDSWPRRLIREPLVHFVLLGAVLFGVYYATNDESPGDDTMRIVIDAAQLENIAATFQRTWLRPPTRQELAGLAEDRVKEEILYREALALGLDQDDLVIRRRLRQKMEFIGTDLAEPEPPTEAELQAYLDANSDKFLSAANITFTQIFLNSEHRDQATELLSSLTGRAPSQIDLDRLGDATLLPGAMRQVDPAEIARVFGNDLAESISSAPKSQWSGPYPSPYGEHLVYVESRVPARQADLSEVRSAVTRDWLAERQREANRRFYEALRSRYSVEIADPKAIGTDRLAMQR
jgi:hypothetical protein